MNKLNLGNNPMLKNQQRMDFVPAPNIMPGMFAPKMGQPVMNPGAFGMPPYKGAMYGTNMYSNGAGSTNPTKEFQQKDNDQIDETASLIYDFVDKKYPE
jgi:hypothetical protein